MSTTDLQRTVERELLLELLDRRHTEPWTVAELERALNCDPEIGRPPLLIRHALGELESARVLVLDGQTVHATECARHLDALGMVSV